MIDAPDGQYPTVNASQLLATNAAGVRSCTVAITPNVKTMVIVFTGGYEPGGIVVVGGTTGFVYPAVERVNTFDGASPNYSYAVPVDAVLDASLTIQPGTPGYRWYVYAHSGIEIVESNAVAAPPAPTQSIITTLSTTNLTTIKATPASGSWYMFGCDISCNNSSTTTLTITLAGTVVANVELPAGPVNVSLNFQGLATGVAITAQASASGPVVILRYAPGP
jgi:hypothetical protein